MDKIGKESIYISDTPEKDKKVILAPKYLIYAKSTAEMQLVSSHHRMMRNS